MLAVIPPKDAFGTSGNSQEGIGAKDTLVFVIDLDSTFPTTSVPGTQSSTGGGALPTITPPKSGSTAGPTITDPGEDHRAEGAPGQDPHHGHRREGEEGPGRRGPVHRGDLADREGLRFLVVT